MIAGRRKVLIADDDEKIIFALRQVFRKEGYECVVAKDGEEAVHTLTAQRVDAVIMDITMPRMNGLDALQHIKELSPSTPVILITGYGTMATAIKAMQLGAFEYLTKPLDITDVRSVVRRALSSTKSHAVKAGEPVRFDAQIVNRYELVGASTQMQGIYKMIGSVSTTPNHTSVLLLGESGTGKELVARAIHANSPNAKEPFVAINCTAIPESLLESELFGHEKGAFTGANERMLGKFEVAGGGTIFLDEIGTLTSQLQQKLLRVLQEREFDRVGGNETLRVRARFIAATNQDLEAEVRRKAFRRDLYFRLNVVTIQLPPLRERRSDIIPLAAHFLSRYNEQVKKRIGGFSEEALSILQRYAFPGNVRELENLIERAVMLTNGEIVLPDAFAELSGHPSPPHDSVPIDSPVFSKSRTHLLDLFERQFITAQLKACHGNVTEAAKVSKMTRQNFQRLMKKHKLRSTPYRK